MKQLTPAILLAFLCLTGALTAQGDGYRFEQNDELGLRYAVFKKLVRIPLKIGESDPHLRAQFQPDNAGDYIHGAKGAFSWGLKVLEFPKKDPTTSGPTTGVGAKDGADGADGKEGEAGGAGEPGGKGEDGKDADADTSDVDRIRKMMRRSGAASFEEWVSGASFDRTSMNRKFIVKGKQVKGNAKRPPYSWFEFTDEQPAHDGLREYKQLWYSCAAVYDLPEREVVLVAHVPVKRGTKADPEHMRWMRRMLESGENLRDSMLVDVSEDRVKDRYADTDLKKKALEEARDNVKNLKHWDYFTTEHYIVLYSWDPGKPEQARGALTQSRDLANQMERMHALYEEVYPPHDKMDNYYSVMRICQDYDEFMKYGKTPSGVVGWFSPGSKELVFFVGGDAMAGKGFTTAVAFHEGWHQYADRYFNFGMKGELHRWFDEGTGDFFGSHEWSRNRFVYETSSMRKADIKQIVREKRWVPIKDIVYWHKDKFYGKGATDFYAQGYAMIDFLRNGAAGRAHGWDKNWDTILETYRKVTLETKDSDKGVKAAFEGVDFEKFEESFVRWVRAY